MVTMSLQEVYIISARRTPIGKFGKSLKGLTAPILGGYAIGAALKSSGLTANSVEEVIMGNVIQSGNGQNPAGQAASNGGLPYTVTKNTVNVVCASGMLAIENAARQIMLGEHNIMIAGGMENMSNSPYLIGSNFRWGVKQMFNTPEKLTDSMFRDGLQDAFYGQAMGYYSDQTAVKFGIRREELDEFSVESQERALTATEKGYFRNEIVELPELQKDEGIRKTDMETLGKLKPSFGEKGLHTAGNSSQISDGASALVLASGQAVKEYGLKPLARIITFTSSSMDPREFAEAPVISTKMLLDKTGTKTDHYDLVEHNEAFAAASLLVRNELKFDPERFNVNGGAIAMGHPLGNSGSRIIVTLVHALKARKLKTGLAAICHGGGGGHSMSLEVIE